MRFVEEKDKLRRKETTLEKQQFETTNKRIHWQYSHTRSCQIGGGLFKEGRKLQRRQSAEGARWEIAGNYKPNDCVKKVEEEKNGRK